MKVSVSTIVFAWTIALAGGYSAHASPIPVLDCFDTEAEAETFQKKNDHPKTDYTNLETLLKQLDDLSERGDVRLSEVEAILGKGLHQKDQGLNRNVHEWMFSFLGNQSARRTGYKEERGHCVYTHPGNPLHLSFTWTSEDYFAPYGQLRRNHF